MNVPRALPVVLVCTSLAGCRLIEATDWNLGQLHGAESGHRRIVQMESHLGYFVGHTLGELVGGDGAAQPGEEQASGATGTGRVGKGIGQPRPVEAPEVLCLGELRDLAAYDASKPRVAALQVSWFARLAVDDPWTLCRERAVLELGNHGRRLALEPLALAGLAHGEAPADAGAVAAALASLLEGLREERAVAVTGAEGQGAGALERACAEVEGLRLDLDGARRLLRGAAHLVSSATAHGTARTPLEAVTRHLERTCVARSLARALRDPVPRVRAAALEASVEAVGPLLLVDIVAQLALFPDEVERVRLLHLVQEHGLPHNPGTSPTGRAALEEMSLRVLVRTAHDPLSSGRTRTAALGALSRLAPGGPGSLREEDWGNWLRERALEAKSSAAEAVGSSPAGPPVGG